MSKHWSIFVLISLFFLSTNLDAYSFRRRKKKSQKKAVQMQQEHGNAMVKQRGFHPQMVAPQYNFGQPAPIHQVRNEGHSYAPSPQHMNSHGFGGPAPKVSRNSGPSPSGKKRPKRSFWNKMNPKNMFKSNSQPSHHAGQTEQVKPKKVRRSSSPYDLSHGRANHRVKKQGQPKSQGGWGHPGQQNHSTMNPQFSKHRAPANVQSPFGTSDWSQGSELPGMPPHMMGSQNMPPHAKSSNKKRGYNKRSNAQFGGFMNQMQSPHQDVFQRQESRNAKAPKMRQTMETGGFHSDFARAPKSRKNRASYGQENRGLVVKPYRGEFYSRTGKPFSLDPGLIRKWNPAANNDAEVASKVQKKAQFYR